VDTTTSTLTSRCNFRPGLVQGGALGTYQMVFAGGLAGGSALWEWSPIVSPNQTALLAAAAGMLISVPVRAKISPAAWSAADLSPVPGYADTTAAGSFSQCRKMVGTDHDRVSNSPGGEGRIHARSACHTADSDAR